MNQKPAATIGTIIFDLDGTLVDSVPDLAGALDTLMAEKGLDAIGTETARRLIGHGIPNLVRSALAERGVAWDEEGGKAAVQRFTEIYGARVSQETRPYAGVVPVLEKLLAEGWRMGVCTNKMERFARLIVDDLDLGRFFKIVAGPDTFKVGKPDPRHLTETARVAGGGQPIVYVGDSEVDIATGKAAGVPVIALTYGYTKTPLDGLGADRLIDSFAELPAALASILENAGSNGVSL
ncbi:phosphoglycolate phosphatase [Rhizobium sp. LjRoot30]|uniref:phosphoglycolate phosphatase n=1 Tax=Rhizobium sp. LjRoot30 TaxID=3342320 RepID=UPI003ECD78E6